MAKFGNQDGTWMALGAAALLGAAATIRRGSAARQVFQEVSVRGTMMALFTPEYVEDAEVETLADQVGEAWNGFVYLPTEDEISAIAHLSKSYSSAAFLQKCLTEIPMLPRTLATAGQTMPAIVVRDVDELKKALWEDGGDRVPGLSDKTSLQRIVWLAAPAEQEAERFAILEALEQRGAPADLFYNHSDVESLEGGYGEFQNMSADAKAKALIQSAGYPLLQRRD